MGADAGARPGAFAVPAAQKEYVYYPSINFRVAELWGPARCRLSHDNTAAAQAEAKAKCLSGRGLLHHVHGSSAE